jgi:murein DD-endopeptidase MepM/ murein hydrolase activator NlpD
MVCAALFGSALVSGCSADIGRFDFPSLGLADKDSATGSIPTPSRPIYKKSGRYSVGAAPTPAATPADRWQGSGDVRTSKLTQPATSPEPRFAPPSAVREPLYTPRKQTRRNVRMRRQQTIWVQRGDTIYGLSRRYKVPMSAIMSLNNLRKPSIRPGQRLVLPIGAMRADQHHLARANNPAAPSVQPVAPVRPFAVAPPLAPAPPPLTQPATKPIKRRQVAGQTYKMQPGDSLYRIARRYKVRVAALQAVNGITDPTKVRAGTVLRIPGVAASTPRVTPRVPRSPPKTRAQAPGRTLHTKPVVINRGSQRLASAKPASQPREPIARKKGAAGSKRAMRFRWPVRGKVIQPFGTRADGTHNDGINLAVPSGAKVVAAESGIVAYAGSELQGYGKLVLIRHDSNWVTAYAHNKDLLVQRGDRIRRGQAIAKAGRSGGVDQPQLHFELRKGSKPVNPLPHMVR